MVSSICKKKSKPIENDLKKIQLNFLFMVSGILSDRMQIH